MVSEHEDITHMMESLIAENTLLKGDAAHMQNLLVESREDLHTLRETLEERITTSIPITEGETIFSFLRYHSPIHGFFQLVLTQLP